MIGTVLACHWMAALPTSALDEAEPATPTPLPESPPKPKEPALVPNVLPPVIPNAAPVPNISGDPNLPGDPNVPVDPNLPGDPNLPARPDEAGSPKTSGEAGTTDETDAPDKPDATNKAFANLVGSPLADVFGSSLGGFGFTTSLTGTYNSNITQGQQQVGNQSAGDFFFGLSGSLNYLSKPGPLTYGGNYRGRYDEYLSRSEFSGYSQGGGLLANYQMERITLSATAGIDSNRGSPQNYSSASTFGGTPSNSFNQNFNQANFNHVNYSGSLNGTYKGDDFSVSANVGMDMNQGSNNYSSSTSNATVESTSIHSGLSGSYVLGPKTVLTGNFSESTSTASGGSYGGTDTYSLSSAAMWKYSPLTDFGPGIHYTYSSGNSSGYAYSGGPIHSAGSQMGRTTLGPTLNVNYKLDVKISLTSQVGLDFARYDNGQSADPTVSGSLALNYQASPLWGMNLAWARNTQADPTSAGAFYTSDSLHLGYNRKIRKASLSAGVSYQTSSSIVPAGVTGGRPNSDTLSLDTSLSMPVFANKGSASVFVRYNDQTGANSVNGSPGNSYNSFQVGFSLSRSF